MKLSSEIIQSTLLPETEPLEKIILGGRSQILCGTDEAGRGPLAGPVVAAAVIFSDVDVIWRCQDSKKLSRRHRELLHDELTSTIKFGIGSCSHVEIDQLNILNASLEAMRRAIASLPISPDVVLVDGNKVLHGPWVCHAVIKGDARVRTIGAASIIAKVERDRRMTAAALEYPEYGFDRHFGYPTAAHIAAIEKFGPCEVHRKTFKGVREYFLKDTITT